MLDLRRFLDGLKALPEEAPPEPELKPDKRDRDRKLKEELDLEAGAVLQATTAPGEGGESPRDGDLVYVHVSVLSDEEDTLFTTLAEQGGSGQPLVFLLGKAWRAPRAWELALAGMTRGEQRRLKVQPSYGYSHPDCRMPAPPGVPAKQPMQFDLQLLSWYPGAKVRAVGDDSDGFKHTLVESDKWEVARAPNEVTFSLELRTPAYDGAQGSGFCYHAIPPEAPCTLQLGRAELPPGLEQALAHMCKGETALFVLPAAAMASSSSDAGAGSSGGGSSGAGLIPPPPSKAAQVELRLQLHELVQVRDVTGDGGVTKKRLREGRGEFPVDCPLHDTSVRLHFRVRSLAGGKPGPWLYDSRAPQQPGAGEQHGGSGEAQAPPVVADTGCGELPQGLEMVLKLMVPGELASSVCEPQYAYQDRTDAPPGLAPGARVEFVAELLDFEREGYWQAMPWDQRWALAERLKAKGNALFRAQQWAYAAGRYTHLLRLLESTRDYEEQQQVERADGLKASLLANLAAVSLQQGEHAQAAAWCDKALQLEPESGKVWLRKGKALSLKGDYEEADEALAAAAELEPALAADAHAARAANSARAKAAAAKQRRQFGNFFAKQPQPQQQQQSAT